MNPKANNFENQTTNHPVMQFKIGLCQLTVTSDKDRNVARARIMLEEAAHMGANLLVLPEMWVCPYSHEHFAKCAETFDDTDQNPPEAYSMLSEVTRSRVVTIIGGSLPERRNDKLYNTCCVFGSDGKLIAKHSKLHLFDYYDSEGNAVFKESDSFTAGDMPTVVSTDVGCIGLGICHDIRFPELAMLYRAKGADMIVYPGAFNMDTGKMLWELETKARAVDNQLFVAVCSPSRDSAGSYTIWGHSMVVGPNGEVKASTEHEEKIVIAEINYSENQSQRKHFNLELQRKQNIYQFVDPSEPKISCWNCNSKEIFCTNTE